MLWTRGLGLPRWAYFGTRSRMPAERVSYPGRLGKGLSRDEESMFPIVLEQLVERCMPAVRRPQGAAGEERMQQWAEDALATGPAGTATCHSCDKGLVQHPCAHSAAHLQDTTFLPSCMAPLRDLGFRHS